MRLVCFVACLLIAMAVAVPISGVFAQDVTSIIHDVSDVADGSIEQARLEAQRQATGAGPAYRSYKKGDSRIFSGKYTPPELPEDKKDRFVYGLAMFSDDGCNVTIKGSRFINASERDNTCPVSATPFICFPLSSHRENPLTSQSTTRTQSTTMTPKVPTTPTSTAARCFFLGSRRDSSRLQQGWENR